MDNSNPLHDLYSSMHSLCQSLQLEVLHSQTQKLCYERLRDSARVEEYRPGRCLTVSYWRDLQAVAGRQADPGAELGYRFSVQVSAVKSEIGYLSLQALAFKGNQGLISTFFT